MANRVEVNSTKVCRVTTIHFGTIQMRNESTLSVEVWATRKRKMIEDLLDL